MSTVSNYSVWRLDRHPVSYFLDESAAIVASSETLDALNRAAADLSDEDRAEVLRFAQFLRFYGKRFREAKNLDYEMG